MTKISKVIVIAVLCALAFVIGFITAKQAKADETSYINRLQVIGPTGPMRTWIDLGYSVCSWEARGISEPDIAEWIVINTGEGIYLRQARQIIRSATQELCPRQAKGNVLR